MIQIGIPSSRRLPDRKSLRIIEKSLRFGGRNQTQSSRAAFLDPAVQAFGRIMPPLGDDHHTVELIGMSACAVGRVTVVILIRSIALHQHGLVDASFEVKRQEHFPGRIGNPIR